MDQLSFWEKLKLLDLPGFTLLTAGLTLFLVGLNLGGGLYQWTDVKVLATMVIGIFVLTAFGIYEWKGTKTGILHHELFRGGKESGRTFSICCLIISVEAVFAMSFIVFYPIM
jgi:hypothetical protein